MAGKTPREPPRTPHALFPCPAEGDVPGLSAPAACIAPGDGQRLAGPRGVPASLPVTSRRQAVCGAGALLI